MGDIQTKRLRECIARYQSVIPALSTIGASLGNDSIEALVDRYEDCYPLLEAAMWGDAAAFDELLACYQSLFREQDALIQQLGDDRHHFILSIPVADRPAHLAWKVSTSSVANMATAVPVRVFISASKSSSPRTVATTAMCNATSP